MTLVTRRTFLRGATGATGLTAVGEAAGRTRATFVVAGVHGFGRLRDRVERVAEATVTAEFVEGRLLVVDGPPALRESLADVAGVIAAVRNVRLRVRAQAEPAPPTAAVDADAAEVPDRLDDEELFDLQWDKRVTAVPAANEAATGAGTTIAVVDTGIDPTHPDLEPNLNVEASRLFRNGRVSEDARDVFGHGTFVAGVAAASAEGTGGIVGAAPDAELVSLRVFYVDDGDDGTPELFTTPLDWVLAVYYAASIGADVVNLSLGLLFPLPDQVEASELRRLIDLLLRSVRPQVIGVVAAGNDELDVGENFFDFPGSIESAVTVGATGPDDRRAFYSTYGEGFVDLGAPGGGYATERETFCLDDGDGDDVGVYCPQAEDAECEPCPLPEWPYPTNFVPGTVPAGSPLGQQVPTIDEEGLYAYAPGTSFAAPQVAGAAALMREVAPGIPADRAQQLLRASADPVPDESTAELGAGRLNAARAVELALER